MPTSSADVLSLRALNRALLDRQSLLRPSPLPAAEPAGAERAERAERVIEMIEHLTGLQAQAPFPPYYGLWSRLAGFRPDDLADLLLSRRVVRIALMRGTIHLVSARDGLTLRPVLQPVLDRALHAAYGRRLAGVDPAAVAAAGRTLVEEKPRTFSELGAELARRWPDHHPDALAQAVRALVPLVQVPPRAVWGKSGLAAHTSAEAWLGRPLSPRPSLAPLVTRYLAAFGPATVRDIQAWSGLTRLREVVEELRPGLRVFRDEQGAELFDLPGAPRPDPDTPAPVRLVAEFDNLILSHADRARVLSEGRRKQLFARPNGVFPGSVLIDGFVTGSWKLTRSRPAAVLAVELYEPVPAGTRDAVTEEGERLLDFAAPGVAHDIRFGPLP
jgi:hypothetical protein